MANQTYKIVILHGTYATSGSNWFSWLEKELLELDQDVQIPNFPTPKDQTIERWLQILDQAVGEYNDKVVLIGHSSAPLVICAKLQSLEVQVNSVFLVAPFLGMIGNKEYDIANSNFNNFQFNWERVKNGAGNILIFRGSNDPYVPEENGQLISKKLGVSEKVIINGGHLNSEAGYDKFPELLTAIKTTLRL